MTARHIRLEDGTLWPRPPLESDEDDGPIWRAYHDPEAPSRQDLLHLAAMAEAYAVLVGEPWMRPKLPMIRRALRKEAR